MEFLNFEPDPVGDKLIVIFENTEYTLVEGRGGAWGAKP